jgi:hypothetical protein
VPLFLSSGSSSSSGQQIGGIANLEVSQQIHQKKFVGAAAL